MKDSKSRKPAAEAAQKKRPHANSFDGNATAKKSKFAEGPKPHTTTEQHAARLSKCVFFRNAIDMPHFLYAFTHKLPLPHAHDHATHRKERKQLSRDRKSRTNKNYNLILEVVGMWETLRRHDTPPARRSEIVTAILKKIDGRVAELAGSHAASRVVQAAIKHGTPQERTSIFKQLQSSLVDLAKSPYGRFVVSKLIDLASKDELQGMCLCVQSNRTNKRTKELLVLTCDQNYCVILPNSVRSHCIVFTVRLSLKTRKHDEVTNINHLSISIYKAGM